MFQFLQILTLVLVASAMAFSLAHAAELPGKLRLNEETYAAVQPIYYPGFTIGAISEPGSIVALVVLLGFTPRGSPAFAWTLAALISMLAMHLVYWMATHPVNRFWLKDQRLSGVGAGFFSFGQRRGAQPSSEPADWTKLRDRWEYSHVVRAGLAMLALILLAIAVTLPDASTLA